MRRRVRLPRQLILVNLLNQLRPPGYAKRAPDDAENQAGTVPGAPLRAGHRPGGAGVWRPGYGVVLLLLAALVWGVTPGFAKKKKVISKTVSGQVLDPKENGLDGATVTLKDLQTGKTISVFTQDGGNYHFSDLKFNHDYEIQANYKGVKSETRQVSSLDTRERLVINFTFPPPTS